MNQKSKKLMILSYLIDLIDNIDYINNNRPVRNRFFVFKRKRSVYAPLRFALARHRRAPTRSKNSGLDLSFL